VFSRAAKSMPALAAGAGAARPRKPEARPAEVMSAILKATVGPALFGGIGTYVARLGERRRGRRPRQRRHPGHRRGDPRQGSGRGGQSRADPERPHRGRPARRRLNTDAIDNSAGVNTSDVEVNIKIALATPERDGRLDPRRATRSSPR
jgi:glutamate dehydrogenase